MYMTYDEYVETLMEAGYTMEEAIEAADNRKSPQEIEAEENCYVASFRRQH